MKKERILILGIFLVIISPLVISLFVISNTLIEDSSKIDTNTFQIPTKKIIATGKTILNSPPTITITKPRDNEVVNIPTPRIEWFYSDPENDPQTLVLLQVGETLRFEKTYETYWYGESTLEYLKTPLKDGTHYLRAKAKDRDLWSAWSDTHQITVTSIPKLCEDGTPFYQCSTHKPDYCDGGFLTNNCTKCGCFENYACVDDNCERKITKEIPKIKTCSDRTLYGECNNDKSYCNQGVLVDNCEKCGCEKDSKCTKNKCNLIKPSFKDILIIIGKFVKNKVGLLPYFN